MSTPTIDTATAASFLEVFSGRDFAHDVAPAMTCTESDAVVGMLRALGATVAAEDWHTAHTAHDDEGDDHSQSIAAPEPDNGTAQ